MSTSLVLRTPVLALSFVCIGAQAQSRCDCSTIVDTCSASVTVENDALAIESDHRQCSRVDYLVDGLPFVALVVEGHERQSRSSANGNPHVLMQSCQVCLDSSAGAPLLATSEAAGDKNVLVHGAGIAHFAINAGLLDEIEIHLVPVLLGTGRRLFVHLGLPQRELDRVRVLEGDGGVTHLRYRIRH